MQQFITLDAPEAVRSIRCDGGKWYLYRNVDLALDKDKRACDVYHLKAFFASSSMIVLTLQRPESFFDERFFIFPDQLFGEEFSCLLVLLNFKRQDLFL